MMTTLISTADVLASAFADSAFYAPYVNDSLITIAQEDWLKNALGQAYYEELLEEKSSAFSTANQLVMDRYIVPALCWYTAWLTLPFASDKMNSLGAMDKYAEYRLPQEHGVSETSRTAYLAIAEGYRSALTGYITGNAAYPTYAQSPPRQCTAIGGLVLGRNRHMD